ncbi:MAG: hypothetical protein Q7R41_11570 [Phycisphaerales bacterium]|nr:hypothetical protein [Phycisphaerales bacterium]
MIGSTRVTPGPNAYTRGRRWVEVFPMLNTGKTGERTETGRCSECGWSNFHYSNGNETSVDGVRGYRCVNPVCGAIKPEIQNGHMVDVSGRAIKKIVRLVEHAPKNADGHSYAPNMEWRVADASGDELFRGPKWACEAFANGQQVESPNNFAPSRPKE